MTIKVWVVHLAVVALPFYFAATTGCGFQAQALDPVKPTNSYGCSCTCSPAPPRHRDLRVSFNEDDSEQQTNNNILLNSPDLDFQNGRFVGLRFRSVMIPAGAMIDSATVTFVAARSSNAGTLTVQIAAQAADKPLPFTTTPGDLSGRPGQPTPCPGTWAAAWTGGTNQFTPNFASAVQQVVNRPGWVPGNDIVLLFEGTAGRRCARPFRATDNPPLRRCSRSMYEEPVAPEVGPLDLQVCMLPADNENIGGTAPDATSAGERLRRSRPATPSADLARHAVIRRCVPAA